MLRTLLERHSGGRCGPAATLRVPGVIDPARGHVVEGIAQVGATGEGGWRVDGPAEAQAGAPGVFEPVRHDAGSGRHGLAVGERGPRLAVDDRDPGRSVHADEDAPT